MDGMDMTGMGGMDMGSEGPFRPTNEKLARGLWAGIAGAIALFTLLRVFDTIEARERRKLQQRDSSCIPSKPRGRLSQAYATVTATVRELAYPQPVFFTGKVTRFFTPLPVGRWLILVFYWIVLLCYVWSDTILAPSSPMYAYKWEKVGFRAAWVSIAQIPFIYLLSCKFNPISLFTNISYERFNWLHRWAARTVFLTVIVHWSFFFREWSLAEFVTLEIQMMPMVKYGFGAWSTIGWMVLSGFGFFRNLSYEIFVAQHICAAATLLWLLHTHVPSYAQYYVYMAIAFIAFDWSARLIWIVLRNTHIMDQVRTRAPGYEVRLDHMTGDMVRLTIDNPAFSWKAGQHMYILIPRLRPLEMHPFTIANAPQIGRDLPGRSMTMVIKAHSGFSKTLHKAAIRSGSNDQTYRAFVSGPWGLPPDLRHYETIVFTACSSGASFIIPLLQDLIRMPVCARRVTFHWIIRAEDHLDWFKQDLISLVDATHGGRIKLEIIVHTTNPPLETSREDRIMRGCVGGSLDLSTTQLNYLNSSGSSSTSVASSDEKTALSLTDGRGASLTSSSVLIVRNNGRPSVESMIRPAVVAALGETAIVVCGGASITAQTRTFVAALSDERAVHKGSGAQGIFLFTETYGW